MPRKVSCLGSLPKPLPDPEPWPCRSALSFRMNEDYFAPVASRGDQVYVVRARHIRAKGGEYVLASGSRRDPRYIIVNVQRATATTYHALIYGWNRSEPRLGKQALRLSRSKWRPAYRVRGITYRPDEGRP